MGNKDLCAKVCPKCRKTQDNGPNSRKTSIWHLVIIEKERQNDHCCNENPCPKIEPLDIFLACKPVRHQLIVVCGVAQFGFRSRREKGIILKPISFFFRRSRLFLIIWFMADIAPNPIIAVPIKPANRQKETIRDQERQKVGRFLFDPFGQYDAGFPRSVGFSGRLYSFLDPNKDSASSSFGGFSRKGCSEWIESC